MTTTFQKRQKEFKRLEKQKAKAEVRRNKAIARREQEQGGGPATSDIDEDAVGPFPDSSTNDIDNPA